MKPFGYVLFILVLLQSCSVKEYKSSSSPIQHGLWDSLMQTHVSEEGIVDYNGLKKDSLRLNKYIDLLSSAHPNKKNWSRDEQLAYWINAYNAFTIKIMVDNYPVESIKDIKNGIPFVNTVWDIKFINIEGANYDLNNLEHGIVRPNFNEPRAHFALNCASYSCPKLRNEAYTAAKLESQLVDQTKYFLNNERKNIIKDSNSAQLSKLFSWYSGDFKVDGKTVVEFINQYSEIQLAEDADISYLDYLWNANDK